MWTCVFVYIYLSTGPSVWYKNFPAAEGSRQSPIDIVPNEASRDRSLDPIIINYDHCTSINISNNGHSVVVEFNDSDDRSGEKTVFFYIFIFGLTSNYFLFSLSLL